MCILLTHVEQRHHRMSGPAPKNTEQEVRKALEAAGSVKAAAVLLGVSRRTVYEYIRRYEIKVRRDLIAA